MLLYLRLMHIFFRGSLRIPFTFWKFYLAVISLFAFSNFYVIHEDQLNFLQSIINIFERDLTIVFIPIVFLWIFFIIIMLFLRISRALEFCKKNKCKLVDFAKVDERTLKSLRMVPPKYNLKEWTRKKSLKSITCPTCDNSPSALWKIPFLKQKKKYFCQTCGTGFFLENRVSQKFLNLFFGVADAIFIGFFLLAVNLYIFADDKIKLYTGFLIYTPIWLAFRFLRVTRKT